MCQQSNDHMMSVAGKKVYRPYVLSAYSHFWSLKNKI